MNCSCVTSDKIFIGCRDRRIFIYNKLTFDLLKTLEVPESVHCMCKLINGIEVAVGMSDGHVIIIGNDSELPGNQLGTQIKNTAHIREIGGIWSICGLNNDTQLALGCISGLHIVNIDTKTINNTNDVYFPDKNIWNVFEYDKNKIACTQWSSPNVFLIDLN